ncbi:hypothetical protein KEM48_004423 [Puccinia striiformis f. sp. tritici PST-130]|nr:hypothetical protein KEM48_004423 [Puccinia striiformis f. sp. tritici PST-130]
MSNKRALGLSEGGSAVCMGPHITRDSPDDPERSKGKGGVFDPKTSLQTPAPKPQHRDSKAPKKRTSNDKSDVTSKRYHRGNKASSKQSPDDQTTTPSKPHHRENNTPADTAASGEESSGKLHDEMSSQFLGTNLNYTPRSTCQVDRGNLLATLTKRKADSLGALADFENPSIVPNVEEHVRITTLDNKCHQPCKLPNIQVWAKVRRSLPPIVTGGAEVLEQVGLTEQTPDCSRLSSNSATPAVEEQHSNPTPVALCGIAVPRFNSTIPPLHVKHEHDLCLSVTPSPCRHQPPVLQEVIPSLVSPESSSLPQALFNLQEGPISPFVPTPWGCSLPSHDEECWCMHSPQAPESPECTPRILFKLPSPSAPEPKQQTSDLLEDQFLLSPLLVHDQVNPRQPILDFSTLPMSESRSIEVLIRNTIDPKLLVILDSRKLQTPGEMCELLNHMYQPTNRRHKLNAIKSLNKLIKCNRTISERWVVDWHQTYFEISQLKLSNDEFMGLFFQASLNLPNEVDPTVLDSLTNRRLENHPNPTFDQVSTEMFHILLDLRFKLDKTLEEPFEAEKPK